MSSRQMHALFHPAYISHFFSVYRGCPTRLSNNSKTEEKEGQIGLQIQKEAIFLVPKAIARQPLQTIKI